VVSSRTIDGRVQVRLIADTTPPVSSTSIEPSLEDGYIAVMEQRVYA
jgi:hypothetical protein